MDKKRRERIVLFTFGLFEWIFGLFALSIVPIRMFRLCVSEINMDYLFLCIFLWLFVGICKNEYKTRVEDNGKNEN